MTTSKAARRTAETTGFAIIPAGVVNHILKHMTLPQIKVYTALLSFAPNIRPSQKRLAAIIGYAQRTTVSEIVNQLEYLHLINRNPRYNGGHEYDVPKFASDNEAQDVAYEVKSFNAMLQTEKRSLLKEIQDDKARAKAESKSTNGVQGVAADHSNIEKPGVAPSSHGELLGADTGGCWEPTQIEEALKEKKKQETPSGLGCSLGAGAYNSIDSQQQPSARQASGLEAAGHWEENEDEATNINHQPPRQPLLVVTA